MGMSLEILLLILMACSLIALACLIALIVLCLQKSKRICKAGFFGIMAVELLMAFFPLTLFLGMLGMCVFVLLILINVVLAVSYRQKPPKAKKEEEESLT